MIRAIGRFFIRAIVVIALLLGAMWVFGPYERIVVEPNFDGSTIGDDVDAYLAEREAGFTNITPGTHKRVIWAGEAGAKTQLSIVYLHGFSATSEEIRPVPDRVASELGANLVYTRLMGHGRSGQDLADATALGWMNDFAEAIEVARKISDEIVVISVSTGGTILAEAALQPDLMKDVRGGVFISPNFRINNDIDWVLTLPAARYWLPSLVGAEQSWEPQSDAHGTYWTNSYPTTAVLQMAALVKDMAGRDVSQANLPALFRYSEDDTVVDPMVTAAVAATWGGETLVQVVDLGGEGDKNSHVIAGDIQSPHMTEATITDILAWIRGL